MGVNPKMFFTTLFDVNEENTGRYISTYQQPSLLFFNFSSSCDFFKDLIKPNWCVCSRSPLHNEDKSMLIIPPPVWSPNFEAAVVFVQGL